jgi:tRNA threonylcarbamoyl adenosine modification protein (Sua5/YciO/YrdC/YwlC family)
MIVACFGEPPPAAAIQQAVVALADGRPVGVPTDTVYGLAADPFVPAAADRIFEAKRRPRDVNLPVLVSDLEQALAMTTAVPDCALVLMERFWPGALTVVLPARPELGVDLGDDEATIGLRCPNHAVPLALCRVVGPLATTSANVHGQESLTTAAEVAAAFGKAVPVVLDAGTCAGSPSTVVDCTGVTPKLLREGRVAWRDIAAALD